MAGFVDTHSHMVPSGDDGVRSVDEGVELVADAGRRGTAVQYATPHAVHRHPFTEQRRRKVMAAREQMRARLAGRVEFRIGWEISPEPWVLEADPSEMAMEGLHACLLELPLPHTRPSSLDLFVACGEHIEQAGLTPILGHPERCDLVFGELGWVTRFRSRGWLAQVNASSLLGRHGRETHDAGWSLIETGQPIWSAPTATAPTGHRSWTRRSRRSASASAASARSRYSPAPRSSRLRPSRCAASKTRSGLRAPPAGRRRST